MCDVPSISGGFLIHRRMEHQRKKRIIYVADDDRAIVDALTYMLESAGYKVASAYDSSVVDMMRERRPDLLLLDIWMSGHDGRDICRQLKSDSALAGVPVIMISAHPDAARISGECGAEDHISKPFEVSELLQKIGRLIEARFIGQAA